MTVTPEGWFDASPGASEPVTWLDDGRALSGVEVSE